MIIRLATIQLSKKCAKINSSTLLSEILNEQSVAFIFDFTRLISDSFLVHYQFSHLYALLCFYMQTGLCDSVYRMAPFIFCIRSSCLIIAHSVFSPTVL